MEIMLDARIDCGDEQVDMNYALETLAGTADTACLLAEAILSGNIITRRTHANEIRANLKHSFKGSYGQKFSLKIENPDHIKKLKKIGQETLIEVMSYYINESKISKDIKLSKSAESIIKEMEKNEDRLIKRLQSPLTKMHKITLTSGYSVALNFRKRGEEPTEIALLTEESGQIITAKDTASKPEPLSVIITRFNSRTGNGRLVINSPDSNQTIPFNFKDPLNSIQESVKKKITENLHKNNGTTIEEAEFMRIEAYATKDVNGKTIKFYISKVV